MISPSQKKRKTNRLITEKSPYLLQHAYNPVNWYPWCTAAFDKAKKEKKLIFLSIGYSTCHWCHVMAHESFEDNEVAQALNETFVCIKVDREERPDIDVVYMKVCQMITGSGGWPLTIILASDKKPVFAGTYFPKETYHGRIGMLELIANIKHLWTTQPQNILHTAEQLTVALHEEIAATTTESDKENNENKKELNEHILTRAYEHLAQHFDTEYGGFGYAPKFPTPHNLLFLLRYWKRTNNISALKMVETTLEKMQQGGVYDHLGFGFHRYAIDRTWLVPHFEKMLYDQALLALAYLEAYQATHREDYATTAREIFRYIHRDMTTEEGAFYSGEDADSDGEEGKFYLWSFDELKKILNNQERAFIIKVFNVTKEGNYHDEATGRATKKNILHLTQSLDELSKELKLPRTTMIKKVEEIRKKLFSAREQRIHPHKDHKILTDWNSLMIVALARGAQVFGDKNYTTTAQRAAGFILKKRCSHNGKLDHCSGSQKEGKEGAVDGMVDDYAFFIWALLELYETTFDETYLETALAIQKYFIKDFWDQKSGGFYFTSENAETVLTRTKEIYDGAVPSGNSVAILNLLRLAKITMNAELEQKALQCGQTFSKFVNQSPSAYTQLMCAVDFNQGPVYDIVIAGDPEAMDTKDMLTALRTHFIPNKVVLLAPTNVTSRKIDTHSELTRYKTSIDNKATAYICVGTMCKQPTTDVNKMLEMLNVKKV